MLHRRTWHLPPIVVVHVNVVTPDQLPVPLEDLLGTRMVRDNLCHATCRMFKIDQLPTSPLGSIDPHISNVVNRIQHLHWYVGRLRCVRSHDDAIVRIQPVLSHLPGKQTHRIPPLVLQTHMEIHLSIRPTYRKLSKGSNRNIDTLTRLVPLPTKTNEDVFR